MFRKCLTLITCLGLLFVWTTALAQATEAPELPEDGTSAVGEWYAVVNGLPLCLSLREDSTYVMTVPGSDPAQGAWTLDDGFIRMDGNADTPLAFNGDTLYWSMGDVVVLPTDGEGEVPRVTVTTGAGIPFTREAPAGYTPAPAAADTAIEQYAGYWKSAYVEVGGQAVPAEAVDENTDLYVEKTTGILGGPLFGDSQHQFVFKQGALSVSLENGTEGVAVTLQMQTDGYLRMTMQSGTETRILYLVNTPSEFLQATALEHVP